MRIQRDRKEDNRLYLPVLTRLCVPQDEILVIEGVSVD
jgi:hypothetical protein